MKKTLALVLGVAVMTNVALAANPTIGTSSVIAPGSEIDITIDQFKAGSTADLSPDYFSISSKKIAKGANLVKEIKIDGDDQVVRIVLNDNMELAAPKGENLVIDTLSIKAKKDTGDVKRNNVLTIKDIEEKVGHVINEITLDGSSTVDLVEGYNKIVKPDSSTVYGDVMINIGDLMLDGRAYADDKIFVKGNYKADTNILKNYPDADMRFIGFKTNGFPTSFNATLAAEEDEFIYKIVDGKLVASGLKWSEDDYAWTGKVRSSTTYVISDTRLSTASVDENGNTTDGDVSNPDTGANDVVGVAAALAVVSLVAAGAVSLKK
ncbi:MAG: hypothetical protein RR461_04565 [Angelakisella sp.]